MSEYIIEAEYDTLNGTFVHTRQEEIVRCRDCKHYYVAESYHPSGNYVRRCCKYFDTYNDEVEPNSFCAWGERRGDAE